MISNLRAETTAIINRLISITYWMRGSIQYFDTFDLTLNELQLMENFISKRLKEENKKPPMANRVY